MTSPMPAESADMDATTHTCGQWCSGELHTEDLIEPVGFFDRPRLAQIWHYVDSFARQGWHVIAVEPALWLEAMADSDAVSVIFVKQQPWPSAPGGH